MAAFDRFSVFMYSYRLIDGKNESDGHYGVLGEDGRQKRSRAGIEHRPMTADVKWQSMREERKMGKNVLWSYVDRPRQSRGESDRGSEK